LKGIFDQGSGPAVVVVQPLQGRWQWMRRFLDALAEHCRVVTYTLCGDFGSDRSADVSLGFDAYVRQLKDVIDRAGLERIALCGISFGGTVAVRYASLYPDRVTHLIIASSPGPGWRANAEQAMYISRPLVTLPVFLLTAVRRLSIELSVAFPRVIERAAFISRATVAAVRYPALPHLMARRVRLMQTVDLAADCERITAPTLVVTGDPSLDLVVPVESTRQYLTHIHNSRYEVLAQTGHSGSLTQPERLASLVDDFIHADHS
jgi:pimeloyl-ACP methyl ester carboxylesterase